MNFVCSILPPQIIWGKLKFSLRSFINEKKWLLPEDREDRSPFCPQWGMTDRKILFQPKKKFNAIKRLYIGWKLNVHRLNHLKNPTKLLIPQWMSLISFVSASTFMRISFYNFLSPYFSWQYPSFAKHIFRPRLRLIILILIMTLDKSPGTECGSPCEFGLVIQTIEFYYR